MSQRRVRGENETNYYHVMSRVVNREYIMGEQEKRYFRNTMRKLEHFCGIHVLTYCIMSNHFHILLEVPTISYLEDSELLNRLKTFYADGHFSEIKNEYDQACCEAQTDRDERWLNAFRSRYINRMGNLSIFVKELKERFSHWYNRRTDRRGTLWEERFKSVLIERSDHALSTIAAYIDLNPVRAGITHNPSSYTYCGYAEAVSGKKQAQNGIRKARGIPEKSADWTFTERAYCCHLLDKISQMAAHPDQIVQEIKKKLESNEVLEPSELLCCHFRSFNEGVALGSQHFVEKVFANNRSHFGRRRKAGAKPIKGIAKEKLLCLRGFVKNAISIAALSRSSQDYGDAISS